MKNGHRTLYKTRRNGKLFCLLLAVVDEGQLAICRVDFQDWDMNRRDGTVESRYIFDEDNTSRLSELLQAETTAELFSRLKSKFGTRIGCFDFIQNMQDYCEAKDIAYEYSVWY